MKETCSLCYKYHNFTIEPIPGHLAGKPHKAALILQEKEKEGWTIIYLLNSAIKAIIKRQEKDCAELRGVKFRNMQNGIKNHNTRRTNAGNVLLYRGETPFHLFIGEIRKKWNRERDGKFSRERKRKKLSPISFSLPPQDSYLPFALIE